MDRSAALQYRKTLADLFAELQAATTPELRAPMLARMHNALFPLHVVDTHAAQHIEEALAKLKHTELAIVNAAHSTIGEALQRMERAINEQPNEPFVMYGEKERIFVKPVALAELESLRTRGRLVGDNHERYLIALDAPRSVADVFTNADARVLIPALRRLGFANTDALVFFSTKAHPKLAIPHEQMPSVRVATLRAGVPVKVVRHRPLQV